VTNWEKVFADKTLDVFPTENENTHVTNTVKKKQKKTDYEKFKQTRHQRRKPQTKWLKNSVFFCSVATNTTSIGKTNLDII